MYLKYFRLKYRNEFEILWKYFWDEETQMTVVRYINKKKLLVQFLMVA